MRVSIRTRHSGPPTPYRGASRAGSPALQQLARAGQDYSQGSHLAKLGDRAQPPMQRKVTIDKKPVEKRTPTDWRLRGAESDMPSSGKDTGYYSDDWKRSFKDFAQYKSYSEKLGQVSVGLIEPYALWYDIEYFNTGEFFVLGEGHGAFGYRHLVAESNIKGNVLGESGTHALMGTKAGALQEHSGKDALKDDKKQPREYIMESIAPKAYYSSDIIVQSLDKDIAAAAATDTGAATKTPSYVFEERDDWLANYDAALPENRGHHPRSHMAYYLIQGTTKPRYYMQPKTSAASYDVYETALRMLRSFQHKASVFLEGNGAHAVAATLVRLDALITQVGDELALPADSRNLKTTRVAAIEMKTLLKAVSQAEDDALTAEHHASAQPALHHQAYAAKTDPKVAETANYYRERAMFQAILKARDKGFTFSGIGDNHAVNLKAAVEAEGIPVITLADLRANHTKPSR